MLKAMNFYNVKGSDLLHSKIIFLLSLIPFLRPSMLKEWLNALCRWDNYKTCWKEQLKYLCPTTSASINRLSYFSDISMDLPRHCYNKSICSAACKEVLTQLLYRHELHHKMSLLLTVDSSRSRNWYRLSGVHPVAEVGREHQACCPWRILPRASECGAQHQLSKNKDVT